MASCSLSVDVHLVSLLTPTGSLKLLLSDSACGKKYIYYWSVLSVINQIFFGWAFCFQTLYMCPRWIRESIFNGKYSIWRVRLILIHHNTKIHQHLSFRFRFTGKENNAFIYGDYKCCVPSALQTNLAFFILFSTVPYWSHIAANLDHDHFKM